MSKNPNEYYSQEEKEAMQDELIDQELPGHYPVDDGYCSCGELCETGTGFARHLKAVRGGPQ